MSTSEKSMLTLQRANSDHPAFQQLILELDRDLAVKNGESHDFFAQYNTLDLIQHIVIAYEGEEAVGCGAMKEYEEGVMEIKRMFVPPSMRKRGIAGKILSELQMWAKELGYGKCVLETGKQMTEAVALYQKSGFKLIPNYPPYTHVEDSVCFEKEIDDERPF